MFCKTVHQDSRAHARSRAEQTTQTLTALEQSPSKTAMILMKVYTVGKHLRFLVKKRKSKYRASSFKRGECTPMFTAASFTVAKRGKQPKCPLTTGKCINNMWSIHTTEYGSALRRKDILTPFTTRMKLKDVIRSQISQTQKDN